MQSGGNLGLVFSNIFNPITNYINDYLKTSLLIHGSIKFSLVINIMFTKVKHDEQIFETPFFQSCSIHYY